MDTVLKEVVVLWRDKTKTLQIQRADEPEEYRLLGPKGTGSSAVSESLSQTLKVEGGSQQGQALRNLAQGRYSASP